MAAPRQQHTATLLADGRVLIVGGLSGPWPGDGGWGHARLVSDRRGRCLPGDRGALRPGRGDVERDWFDEHGRPHRDAAPGRARARGWQRRRDQPPQPDRDLSDPATGRFRETGTMKTGRWMQTATLLQDGRVLILGGRSPEDSVYASVELYDPRSGAFSSAGSMLRRPSASDRDPAPGRTRLFIAGGYWQDGQKSRDLSSTEMYDPRTGRFSVIGSMGARREWPHRDAPERRPGPHRRRRGHRERERRRCPFRPSSTSRRPGEGA